MTIIQLKRGLINGLHTFGAYEDFELLKETKGPIRVGTLRDTCTQRRQSTLLA
jgi:hypothetical protein